MSKRGHSSKRSAPGGPGRRTDADRARAGVRTDRPGAAAGRRLSPVVLASAVVVVLGLAAVAALVGSGVWAGGASQSAKPSLPGLGERPASRINASGRLLIPLEGGLSLVSLPDREVTELAPAERSGAITSAQWSPDGKLAAYAFYHIRSGDSAASSEIYLTDLAGEPRVLVGRDRPGTALEAPAWAPDGQAIYFTYNALEGQRVVQRIERTDLSGNRTVVVDGVLPAVSPDGQLLARISSDRNGDSLVVTRIDGQDPRELIPAGRFSVLGTPRFSPDGRTLAIPASGGAQARDPTPTLRFGLLAPAVALAHGEPWEVFLVDLEGGEPRRLTHLVEDEISAAWSPDGAQLAVYGSRGLYLVDRDGRTTFALDRGGYGGIDWSR